jgi:acyl carrier protein
MQDLAVIRQFLADRCSVAPEEAVPEATLERLGIDSLLLLELMFEFEDREGIKVPDDLPQPRTVADLLAVLTELRAGRRNAAS